MTDHDRHPEASPQDPGYTPDEPTAGPANTPPFEASDPHSEGSEGRPPSHREHIGKGADAEGMEAIAPARRPERGASHPSGAESSEPHETVADSFEAAADRVHDKGTDWTEEGRFQETAGRWADRAADVRDEAADYLHAAGVDDIRALVEKQVRERPLQSLLLAAATGWLVGKILR